MLCDGLLFSSINEGPNRSAPQTHGCLHFTLSPLPSLRSGMSFYRRSWWNSHMSTRGKATRTGYVLFYSLGCPDKLTWKTFQRSPGGVPSDGHNQDGMIRKWSN